MLKTTLLKSITIYFVISLFVFPAFSQSYHTVDLVAVKDTNIKLKKDNENFGTCQDLYIDRESTDLMRALFQFDVSSIPTHAHIQSAELRLNCTDGKDLISIDVFRIENGESWDEGSGCALKDEASNWLQRTSTENWSAEGVIGDPGTASPEASFYDTELVGIHTWDITCLTGEWVTGALENNGIMVGCQDGGGDRKVIYDSRETTTGIPPTLRITYTIEIDHDYDGVDDTVDIDDDNDGLIDTIECPDLTLPKIIDADFENIDIISTGLDGGPTDVVGTYGIWKGDASNIPFWQSSDLTNNHLEIWHNSQAAGNDAGGTAFSGSQWAEINASTNDGFYQDIVTTPGYTLQWSFAHRKRTSYAGSSSEDILELFIGDPGGTMTSMGTFSSANDASWTQHSGTYIVPVGQTTTRLTFQWVASVSGSPSVGNFVDDVRLSAIPVCVDTDGDGIEDYFDLDSDNDGIPDIVEAGLGSASDGKAIIPLTSFVDANGDGLHDPFADTSAPDFDGDGTPDYLDLDSDNDAVFDVDEARTERYSFGQLVFENGDGDINGDGVGDGPESEAFRIDASCEGHGDGILDLYDYGTGANEYGNLGQGSAPEYVNNDDGTDTPDFIDLDSNNDGIFDIEETLYAHLDANNDGMIDDTNDADGDGLMDAFDTNDTQRGSPRDLNEKLHLYFDGRNDYGEDITVMDQWSEATLMAWIRIDPTASGSQVIIGQDSFYIQLNSDKSITAYAGGYNVSNGAALTLDQWTHVAATYSNSEDLMKIFINGEEIASVAVTGNLDPDSSNFTLGREPGTTSKYFKGYLDEVRVFSKALANNELQKMVYQEIDDNSGTTRGTVIPLDITNFEDPANITPLDWTNLERYYRLDAYKDDVIDDYRTLTIDEGSGAKIYNSKLIKTQTAPMPFVTTQSGDLVTAISDSDNGVNGNDAINYDYSIVKIQHDGVNSNARQKHIGLIVDELDEGSNPIEFTVDNDSELNVSWYIKLDGTLDLEGESQLIQGLDSKFDVTSKGKIERDQQGSADVFTYNYWSSPVGVSNETTNNNSYTVADVMRDGGNPINWISSGYNGTDSNPIGIADYWIWKYSNQPSDDYSAWQHVRSTGSIDAGEGFTMKGPGSGAISDEQNYTFEGKPNNGDITLPLNAGNDYLVGNPYPSALDAHQFILDNAPIIEGGGNTTGTLYFWEHWGGGTHNLSGYQGGYATYNLSGGTPAATMGTNDPDVGMGGTPLKTPGRYIPVSQGFFVTAESNGTINFNNGQRIFHREADGNSTFMEANPDNDQVVNSMSQPGDNYNQDSETDDRMQMRLGFSSVNSYNRQILLTVDEKATEMIDWGYDGQLNESQTDDLYWMIEDEKFTIQGIGFLDAVTTLPLGIHTGSEGMNSIRMDDLINAPDDLEIYIHDKELNVFQDIMSGGQYDFFMEAGENLTRFEIVFQRESLDVTENELTDFIDIYFSNSINGLALNNPQQREINSIKMYNLLGQLIFSLDQDITCAYCEFEVNNLSTGVYTIQMKSDGETNTLTKNVLVD